MAPRQPNVRASYDSQKVLRRGDASTAPDPWRGRYALTCPAVNDGQTLFRSQALAARSGLGGALRAAAMMQTHTAPRPGVVRRCAGTTRRNCEMAARAAPHVSVRPGGCNGVAMLRLLARPRLGVLSRRNGVTAASAAQADGVALPQAERCTFRIGDSEIHLETGRVGRQAGGAIMATEGETVLYTTICASEEQPKDKSFLPLTVVYQERFSAAGRTASGFVKRDGK